MTTPRCSRCVASCASLFLATSLLLTGCSGLLPVTTANTASVTGNWQIASSAASAARLSKLSGELTGNATSMTGILHSDSASSCVAPTVPIDVTGTTNTQGITTLTGANLAGGALSITGTLAADGKSFSNATYTVTGGTCAFTTPAGNVTAGAFSPITGNYAGTFSDPGGQVIAITASLSQSPSSDPNGNFTLTGTGTFPSNPCFNSPVTVSNTQVTGGSFTLTYADAVTQNSVTASGTFSSDGTTLTVTNWVLTGPCGPDTGTGLLTRQ